MNHQTPREVLGKFYEDNHFDLDGGQESSSVKVKLTSWLHFHYPNYNARRKAVLKHDIHHLLTGYTTKLSGECEISAWEIGSGCRKYWAAFLLDTSGVMISLPINFRIALKAFARGRRTKNLYHDQFTTEQELDTKTSELQALLLLDKNGINTKPSLVDVLLFMLFASYGFVYSTLLFSLLPLIIIYSIYVELK